MNHLLWISHACIITHKLPLRGPVLFVMKLMHNSSPDVSVDGNSTIDIYLFIKLVLVVLFGQAET